MQADVVADNFRSIFSTLVDEQLIMRDDILYYSKANEHNLHSLLQYCLIKSAEEAGLRAIPEFKIRLARPFRPEKFDSCFKDKNGIHQFRADVAFLESTRFLGFGEVYTIDEVHGCKESADLDHPWVSPRHKLLYLAKNALPEFTSKVVTLVNVIPEELKMHWKDRNDRNVDGRTLSRRYLSKWKKLAEILRHTIDQTKLITIQESQILVDGKYFPLRLHR